MISEFSSVKSNYFLIPCVSIMINDFYCVKLMTLIEPKRHQCLTVFTALEICCIIGRFIVSGPQILMLLIQIAMS